MKKLVIHLTSMHKIPKIHPGGPGYMIEMIDTGLNSVNYGWCSKYVGLEQHQIPSNNSIGKLKNVIKLYSPRIIRARAAKLRVQSWALTFLKVLEKNRSLLNTADLVHIHDVIAFDAYQRFNPCRTTPIIFTDHYPGSFAQGILRYVPKAKYSEDEQYLVDLEYKAASEANLTTLISTGQQTLKINEIESLRKLLNGAPIVYNGIKETHLIQTKKTSRSLITIGFVGSLTFDKGVDTLVEAFINLSEKYRYVQLAIIGDGPLKEDLLKRVTQVNLQNSVKFYGLRNDVPELLISLDIFVSCGRRSGFDLAILEAMRASLAIIVSDVGGNKEAVGDTAIVIPEDNKTALQKSITSLIENLDYRVQLGNKARVRFEKHFTINVMTQMYASLYDGIVATVDKDT